MSQRQWEARSWPDWSHLLRDDKAKKWQREFIDALRTKQQTDSTKFCDFDALGVFS